MNSLLSATSPASLLSTVLANEKGVLAVLTNQRPAHLKVATTLGTPSLTALYRGPGRADTRIWQHREAERASQEKKHPEAGWLGL